MEDQGQQVRVVALGEVDPGRTAGGESRPLAAPETAQEFGTLLHDDDIGGEIGVEHDIGPELAQCRDDLTLNVGPGREAEFLTETDPHRGGELEDGHDPGVEQIIEHPIGFVALPQGTGRADQDTLTAGHAGRLRLRQAVAQSDSGLQAGPGDDQRVDRLAMAADGDTALAAHALGHVADERRG